MIKNKKIKTIVASVIMATSSIALINNNAFSHVAGKSSVAVTKNKKSDVKHDSVNHDNVNHDSKAASKLIDTVTHGQAKITGSFKAIGNLEGYIIAPKQGPQSQEIIVFVPKSSKYVLFGNLISADGSNLSEAYKQKYITSKQAVLAYDKIHTMKYITLGPDSAPHKLYALIDTDCSYCNLLYKELKQYTEGKNAILQIRFIPVAIRGAGSRQRAAEIVQAQVNKGNSAAAKLLDKDEMSFDMSHEAGGLKGIDETTKGNKKYFDIVDQHTKFFTGSGFGGTPVLLYIDKKTGKPTLVPGYIPKPQQVATIEKMSDSWVVQHKSDKS